MLSCRRWRPAFKNNGLSVAEKLDMSTRLSSCLCACDCPNPLASPRLAKRARNISCSMKGRMLWLGGTYAAVLVAGWPVLAMVVLGLADAVFGFRQRYLQRKVPPPMAAP